MCDVLGNKTAGDVCKLGPSLTGRACPEAHSQLLLYVKFFRISTLQRDSSPSQGSGWLVFMGLMNQEKKQQSTQAHYALSVYSQAVWAVLKALPKYIQHSPCQAIFF